MILKCTWAFTDDGRNFSIHIKPKFKLFSQLLFQLLHLYKLENICWNHPPTFPNSPKDYRIWQRRTIKINWKVALEKFPRKISHRNYLNNPQDFPAVEFQWTLEKRFRNFFIYNLWMALFRFRFNDNWRKLTNPMNKSYENRKTKK